MIKAVVATIIMTLATAHADSKVDWSEFVEKQPAKKPVAKTPVAKPAPKAAPRPAMKAAPKSVVAAKSGKPAPKRKK